MHLCGAFLFHDGKYRWSSGYVRHRSGLLRTWFRIVNDHQVIGRAVAPLDRDAVALHLDDLRTVRQPLVQPIEGLESRGIIENRSGKCPALYRADQTIEGGIPVELSMTCSGKEEDQEDEDENNAWHERMGNGIALVHG